MPRRTKRIPEIGLRVSRRMGQRHEHFLVPQARPARVILHYCKRHTAKRICDRPKVEHVLGDGYAFSAASGRPPGSDRRCTITTAGFRSSRRLLPFIARSKGKLQHLPDPSSAPSVSRSAAKRGPHRGALVLDYAYHTMRSVLNPSET